MLSTDISTAEKFDLSRFRQYSAPGLAVAEQPSHAAEHDDGLAHNHHWAAEPARASCALQPLLAHTASVRTPSCVVHDDIHYGRD